MPTTSDHPLRLPIANRALRSLVESACGLRQLAKIYDVWLERTHVPIVPVAEQFLDFSLEHL